MEAYHKTVLDNGLRVVTETVDTAESASIGLWIMTGSRDETLEENGLCHFIEHLFFKGTEGRSAYDISREIESVGGSINAFTGKEYTCIHVKVLPKDLGLAMNILVDIFGNSVFDPQEIERERMVVLHEIKMTEDTPDDYVHDLFNRFFWGGNSLGFPITGGAENILSSQREQITSFFREHYTPDRVIVAAAGRVDHQQVVESIASRIGRLERARSKLERQAPNSTQNGISVVHRDLEQIHLCLGTRGVPYYHSLRYAGHSLNILLGGNMSSRLFQEIREKRGLTYSVFSFLNMYQDTGLFAVYAGTAKDEMQEVIELILRELRELKAGRIRNEELAAAKEYLKGGMILSLESSDGKMSRLAKNEIYWERNVPVEESLGLLEKVTERDVVDAAQEMFNSHTLCLTLLGTLQEDELPWEKLNL